ncbi:alpha-2,8-polysialyltransferase family protein [Streptomyces sp. H27-C3]|uniref:alpha-2,8-polysialyltransferase family protein n=1 Tax=Streptomyces sp. H27-C3 TaxID=3046305 RepID=UPI0024BA3575|nr:alpha-2,8-polysialyltransferase family protein [Streptomyces sp. H27-C3]MDJ0464115.1 alpha-2,8-polysialyltransferase family protein [Streptomyces sp. H27-C3]
MGTTQIFLASTLYGAATLAAAIDSDCFGPADRRLLLVSNNATTPETTPSLDEMPGFDRLRDRFDGLLSWNETIAPFHPGGWAPRADDIPLWQRHLRLLWDLGEDKVELAVESIQVNPALALTQLFTDAPIDVYADGLMSYGPTRNKIDPLVGMRVQRLLHLDLVPGLEPLLLGEFGVRPELVPTDTFLKVLAEVSNVEPELDLPSDAALLLGQYLSALSILTPEEEEDLHVRMLRGAVARGHRRIVFKPHPTAPARWSRLLEREAAALGVELTVLDSPLLAEVLYQRIRPALVVGCFSTALLTASTFYGIPVARTGTDVLLERLAPYQNSNRVPVTIVDALVPDLESGAVASDAPVHVPGDVRADVPVDVPVDVAADVPDLAGLLRAVGFAMQPQIRPDLRSAAEAYLTRHLGPLTRRYFKRRRLTMLALPGALPAQFAFIPRNATVRGVARRARRLKRVALG